MKRTKRAVSAAAMAQPPAAGRQTPAGAWVRTLEGYLAFHPNPLPPPLAWEASLVNLLANASTLVGRLAGEGRRLPNLHVLIRPFVRREAVLSSRIEGTQATLGELLAAEAGARVERSPDDLREVGNYVTIDWTERETVRARIRVAVKRILRKHGYPPDKQEKATATVLEQAKLLCADWAG